MQTPTSISNKDEIIKIFTSIRNEQTLVYFEQQDETKQGPAFIKKVDLNSGEIIFTPVNKDHEFDFNKKIDVIGKNNGLNIKFSGLFQKLGNNLVFVQVPNEVQFIDLRQSERSYLPKEDLNLSFINNSNSCSYDGYLSDISSSGCSVVLLSKPPLQIKSGNNLTFLKIKDVDLKSLNGTVCYSQTIKRTGPELEFKYKIGITFEKKIDFNKLLFNRPL